MRILVTGGAGFIGSHMAEYYAGLRCRVTVFDNLSRVTRIGSRSNVIRHNWDRLGRYRNVQRIHADIRDAARIEKAVRSADVVIHCAGQTAVTTSVVNPRDDFENNAIGTFNVLEAVRRSRRKPALLYCSTNKVYGDNVNRVPIGKRASRYYFRGKYATGIPEHLSIDLCEHSPYGCSKLTGDVYLQEYAERYGLKIGIFRMSCIYGTKQFGVEDQGWVAWFTIATLLGYPLTIFGDGRQVRDILYISDLVRLFERFIRGRRRFGLYNVGGGPHNTLSLVELLERLYQKTGQRSDIDFQDWRPSDQRVYVSDISKVQRELRWKPRVGVSEGLDHVIAWTLEHKPLLEKQFAKGAG